MSFGDCINNAENEGALSRREAERARRTYQEALEGMEGLGADAEPAAARSAFERMEAETAQRKRQTLLQARAYEEIAADFAAYRNERGEAVLTDAMMGLVDSSGMPTRRPGAFQNYQAIRGRAHAHMQTVIRRFARDLAGRTRNKAELLDVVREAFGEDTGNAAAKALARAWGETSEKLRELYNAQGGHIGYNSKWGGPQTHDADKIRAAGYEAWRNHVLPRLDLERMIDGRTGKPFTPSTIEQALKDVFENIKTDGWAARTPSGLNAGRARANRRADPRFLVFRDADAWMEYQDAFSKGDFFDAMMGHIDGMSRDIALMQALGPNPNAGLTFAEQTLRKMLTTGDGVEGRLTGAESAIHRARQAYELFTGTTNRPVNATLARVMGNTRQLLTAAHLGSAVISAVSDIGFTRITARMNGMRTDKVLGRAVSLLDVNERNLAMRLGLIAEEATQMAAAQHRYIGEVWGGELSRQISDTVLKVSGLSPWTQTMKWAFGMELSGFLADNAGRAFKDLPKALQGSFKRYNISAAEWERMRSAPLYDGRGSKFLRPEDIAAIEGLPPGEGDRLANKLLAMVHAETNFAIPSASLIGRSSFLPSGAKPGTVSGELLRSTLLFKNFAVTMLFTHVRRAAMMASPADRLAYTGELLISSALLGAFALQAKEVTKGRDPRPMAGSDFWFAALLQGGGLGIFGDFMFADANRFGGGIGETVAGPVFSAANDLRRLTVGNAQEWAAGESLEESDAALEAVDFMSRYTPGSSIWYARLALDRYVWDRASLMADPDAADKMQRAINKSEREGQGYFFPPGAMKPQRAPDLAGAAKPPPE